MPIQLHYDIKQEILYCSCAGSLSFEECESAFYTMTHAAEYPPDVKTLWNFETLDLNAINKSFMNQLIVMRKKFPKRSNAHVALIAPSDLGFGLSRMFESFSKLEGLTQNLYVFRTHGDGEKWLLRK